MSHRHRLAVGLVAVGGAVGVAACGTGASSYSASGSAAQSSSNQRGVRQLLEVHAHARRDELPRPGRRRRHPALVELGDQPVLAGVQGGPAEMPQAVAGRRTSDRAATAQAERQALETSECMRKHGVSGFPDPTLKAPSSPAGYRAIEDRGGVILAIPSTINMQSPAFQKAARRASSADRHAARGNRPSGRFVQRCRSREREYVVVSDADRLRRE